MFFWIVIARAKVPFFFLFLTFFWSCSPVKKVKKGDYLLAKNTVYVDGKKKLHTDLEDLLSQKPNKKLFGLLRLKLQLYNLINPAYDSILPIWDKAIPKTKAQRDTLIEGNRLQKGKFNWNYWLYRIGEPPVIYDSIQTKRAEEQLRRYMFAQGYFDATVSSEVRFKAKRARVKYRVDKYSGYIVDTLSRDIQTPALDSLYLADESSSRILAHERYKRENLVGERERLTDIYRNAGYYDFNKSHIAFLVDTNDLNHRAKLTLTIKNPLVGKTDSLSRKPFQTYTFDRVNAFVGDHPPDRGAVPKDTAYHKGYYLYTFDSTFYYRPRAITDAIDFSPGDLYRKSVVNDAYSHLNSLQNFTTRIDIRKDSAKPQSLIADIYLVRYPKYRVTAGVEGSFSNYFGLSSGVNLSLLSRNVFGGAENLQLSGSIKLGRVKTGNKNKNRFLNAVEGVVQADLSFPRFWIPFLNSEGWFQKKINPQTHMLLSLSRQNNIGLGKRRLTGILDYQWQHRPLVTHRFELFNVQYVYNSAKDQYYKLFPNDALVVQRLADAYVRYKPDVSGKPDQIAEKASGDTDFVSGSTLVTDYLDMKFRRSRITDDFLFSSMTYSFTYDQQLDERVKNPWYCKGKIESSGNLLNGLQAILNAKRDSRGAYRVLNAPIAQYLKLDLDFRKFVRLSYRSNLAMRLLMGAAYPYGNSQFIPFDKSYLAGGSNDVRAWRAYELGPAGVPNRGTYALGNIKLTTSLEYRFDIWDPWKGALFIDAGNIWDTHRHGESVGADRSDSFYRQLGIGGGLGLRYDFGFFLIRLDGAWKFHDPSLPLADRWCIDKLKLSDITIHFGVGYPF